LSDNKDRGPSYQGFLFGCFSGAIILLLVLGAVGVLLYLKSRQMVRSFSKYPASYIHLYQEDTFTPPVDGVIPEERFQLFLEANYRIWQRMEELKSEGKSLESIENLENIQQAVATLSELRKTQVVVLQELGLSLKEYKWINKQIVLAYGRPLVEQMIQWAQMMGEDLRREDLGSIEEIPQENIQLFGKYRHDIEQMVDLWVLGL